MKTNQTRTYNCKNEELPTICNYVAFSLKNDLPDFTAYSPKMNEAYLNDFCAKIDEANELVNPRSETMDMKAVTTRLYATMDSANDLLNRLTGYIKLAKGDIPVSLSDFGITPARKKITSKDAEGVVQSLKLINTNIKKYKKPLAAQGLTDEFMNLFTQTINAIAADNQKQYEMMEGRKALVQKNLKLLNTLYEQMVDICHIGKILYKGTNPLKLQEYTFTELKKRVRIVVKPVKPAKEA